MEGTTKFNPTTEPHRALACADAGQSSPFSQQWVTITKQEHIDLACRASYWEAQHARVKSQLEEARQDNLLKDAKIKDLQNRLFGKKSEKNSPRKSEKDGKDDSPLRRRRGQQPGSRAVGGMVAPNARICPSLRMRSIWRMRRNAVQPADSPIGPTRPWTSTAT